MQHEWPRNDSDVEDDAYKLLAFTCSWKMDQLMLANNIANSKEVEPISPTYLGEGMTKKNDKMETTPIAKKCIRDKMTNTNEEKQTTLWATPRS